MQDEEKQTPPAPPEEEQAQPSEDEEVLETPANKYERIMMAAAEASRLNEEMRRKGVKLDRKVTIEALRRVDEGRVKAVLENKDSLERKREEIAAKSGPPGTFFLNPPSLSDADESEARGGRGGERGERSDRGDQGADEDVE